jgi:hypothetical protein
MALIDDGMVRVLESACVMTVGTRDANLEPHFTRALGGVAHADREHVTFFVPRVLAQQAIRDLEDNGRIAFQVVAHGASNAFKAFQLKGRFVSHRDAHPEEERLQTEYKKQVTAACREMGIPHGFWLAIAYNPATAVTFAVEEAFNQTPGPGAGERTASR